MSRAAWSHRAVQGFAGFVLSAAAPLGAADNTPRGAPEATPPQAQAAEDIRDIRSLTGISGSSLLPALIAGSVLVAVASYAIWRRYRRPVPARELTLSELTLRRLQEARPLMNPDTAREFGIAASEAIRNYIEKRFDVVATQRTTEEFLHNLLENPDQLLARYRSLLAEFLQLCDYVKFAGASLAAADLESLYESARSFVVETGLPVGA